MQRIEIQTDDGGFDEKEREDGDYYRVEDVDKEIQRLRKALGFYAKQDSWWAKVARDGTVSDALNILSPETPENVKAGWLVAEEALKEVK